VVGVPSPFPDTTVMPPDENRRFRGVERFVTGGVLCLP